MSEVRDHFLITNDVYKSHVEYGTKRFYDIYQRQRLRHDARDALPARNVKQLLDCRWGERITYESTV